jgi:hypothetical protein
VVKVQAGQELQFAVESVMQGKRFVSSGLDGHNDTGAVGPQVSGDGATPLDIAPLVKR